MTFEKALSKIKNCEKLCIDFWEGEFVGLSLPDGDNNEELPETLSYIVKVYPTGHRLFPKGSMFPWTPDNFELFTDKWIIYKEL